MTEDGFTLTSRPYRSLGPRGFQVLFAIVIGSNLFGAIVFASLGAWPVSGFMGLDVLALYLAFRVSYRQAIAVETIRISQGQVTVRRCDRHGVVTSATLPSYWAQVAFDGDEEGGDVSLRSHGKSIAVGRFLPGFERAVFAETLRKALYDARTSVPHA